MRKYVPSPKHGSGPVGVRGSAMDLSDSDAQSLLNDTGHCLDLDGKKQFVGLRSGKFYVFQPDNAAGFHGYRVSGNEICVKFPKAAKKFGEILKVDFKRLQKMS